jgi:hypothetical protein
MDAGIQAMLNTQPALPTRYDRAMRLVYPWMLRFPKQVLNPFLNPVLNPIFNHAPTGCHTMLQKKLQENIIPCLLKLP